MISMGFHDSVQDQIWLRVTEVFFSRVDLFAYLTIRAQHRFSLCIFFTVNNLLSAESSAKCSQSSGECLVVSKFEDTMQ